MSMALAASFLVLLLSLATVYGDDHTVGGSAGWSLAAGDYTTWAAGRKFIVGDNLVFNYDSRHGVDLVSKHDFKKCSSKKPINSFRGGSTKVALSSSGKMYFICPTAGHCSGGMKLKSTVVAAGSKPPSGNPSTTPAGPPQPPYVSGDTPVTGTTVPPPLLMHFNGAVSRFGSITYLMVSLFVSAIVLAFMG